jgi:hypothetical protein
MMTAKDRDTLLTTLQARFERYQARHTGIAWPDVLARLDANPSVLASLHAMESTGGEPDVIGRDAKTGVITFVDCAPESPSGRRSGCYDRAALDERKENKPKHAVVETAKSMGIALLTEEQYRHLQTIGEFDLKTSSWILTPPDVRALGGALFCDRRYGRVFTYHNGVQSYYAARGFRGVVRA